VWGRSPAASRPQEPAPQAVPTNIVTGTWSCGAAGSLLCTAIAGLDVGQIHHLQLATEAGLGVADLAQIEVRGAPIAAVRRPFVPYPVAARARFGAATIVERNTCTGCMGELASLFIYLRQAGFEGRFEDLALIMGTPEEVPELETLPVGIGKCARAYSDLGVYMPGCPPHGMAITDAACEALGIDAAVVHRAIEALHDF
jgi:hypothetical protein